MKGLLGSTLNALKHENQDDLQSVIGGWGDEKASTSKGSGMTPEEAQSRQKTSKAPAGNGPPGMTKGDGVIMSGTQGAPARRAKRPQLKRVQHDDPFEAEDMIALDDERPEELQVH